jgi:hypothetical protein
LSGPRKKKSNGNINFHHTNAFNDFINRWGLLEIKDKSRNSTWSNNQECPVMATLDRILATVDWECKFPLAMVRVLPKGISDHDPLRISFGIKTNGIEPIFRFEKWWLEMEDFSELVRKTWE